ncbi:cytochrome P450 [Fusarium flagelliforme]|uniref:Cytochrome p450 n=1 Tax=Fusarium flagelliforme TaxID=2675880 RepID=A0A395MUS6_9HYPO|nr:cytochrome P450 [Fusarium flagelliforme]KAH7191995.1 cytochrome P450 [Fusarium flagelliforme]RFN51477.1 hypothetical protein FIE12Z_4213 [Fusarium flagelliforme]
MGLSTLYENAAAGFSSLPLVYKVLSAVVVVFALNIAFGGRGKGYKNLPAYAPIELAIASYILSGDGIGRRIFSAISRYGGSLFGITSGHQIAADLPGVERLLSQSHHIFDSTPAQYSLLTLVFGSPDSPQLRDKLHISLKDLVPPLERTFLNDAASTAAVERSHIEERGASLVTFSSDRENMARWELSADVKVLQAENPGIPGKVEANLQSLTRDFGACMSIPLIYGQDILERHPQILDDFWVFDNELFPLLMVGIPQWAPFKMMQDGLKARTRIIDALEGVYKRIEQERKGEAIDFNADVSDVSTMLRERNGIYNRDGWTLRERAAADLGTFWGLNANAQPVLFWFLLYVYSTPGLLERIREEISPYIRLSAGEKPEIAGMDFQSLFKKCQLFKACIFETYRLVNEPTSIRHVSKSVSITDGDRQHNLNQGTYISVPLALKSRDPALYEDPDSFIPDRFLETDSQTGKATARYGKLKPWGIGAAMCKGRTFAEKEIISLGSAVVSLWDIKPVDGVWRLPAMIPGTGVKKPVNDIRVIIQRRVV